MLSALTQGFFLQASLMLALGAQNVFVLNSGLNKQRHFLVALISSVCDTVLIFIGVLGVATIFIHFPMLKVTLGLLGVGFLFFYGFLKLKDAKTKLVVTQKKQQLISVQQAILTSLGFSLLNPHVYLDTVVLLGGYSSKFLDLNERFYFATGASLFSIIWFFGLAYLASAASRLLNKKGMQIVSLVSGLLLIALGLKLGIDVLSWI